MSDEFDDAVGPTLLSDPRPSRPRGPSRHARLADLAPRLVGRLYARADKLSRTRMLACLLRPLGILSLGAVAAGAFAGFIGRAGADGLRVSLDDASRFSAEQVVELARFVQQISPEALQQLAQLIADAPGSATAFSVTAAVALLGTLSRHAAKASGRRNSRYG